MTKIAQDNQNGFTLIEIMITMLVLSIGILGVVKMQVSAVKGNSYASGLTEATTIAQDKMEELAALAYDHSDLDDDDGDGTSQDADNDGIDDAGNNFGLDDTTSPDGSQQAIGATNIQYAILWNIAVNEPADNAKRVRVYVQWQQKGVTRRVILNQIKADF
jgi:type IV pilus modification protein PilV